MKTIALIVVLIAVANATLIKSKKQSRLLCGDDASPGQFPYAVELRNDYSPLCGGAIVGPRHVLTEAWCINFVNDAIIVAGCLDPYNDLNCTAHIIEAVWVHPNYTGIAYNDLAVISVTDDFVLSDKVAIGKLSEDVIQEGARSIVTGWSPNLRYLDSTVRECNDYWTGPTLICSSPSAVGGGDYGSPLIVNGSIAGIAVIGGYLDVHQRVSSFVPWIQSVVQGNNTDFMKWL